MSVDQAPDPSTGGAAAGEVAGEGHERVARLDDLWLADGIAIHGDDLYLSGGDGKQRLIYRCKKDRCEGTLERLPLEDGSLSSIQVYEGRLAGERTRIVSSSLVTYDLPSLVDEQVAISDLYGVERPLFSDGYVYWLLAVDEGIYRCALPSCPAGPERLGQAWSDLTLAGRYVFWGDLGSLIYRAPVDEREPPQRLVPDDELGAAPDDPNSFDSVPEVLALAGSPKHLYAVTSDVVPSRPVTSEPTMTSIVRWPVEGGARTVLLEEVERAERLFLFGEELVWIASPSRQEGGAVIFSCSVSDCAGSQRSLGSIGSHSPDVIADATHLYWVAPEESGKEAHRQLMDREVRRVPLLPQ